MFIIDEERERYDKIATLNSLYDLTYNSINNGHESTFREYIIIYSDIINYYGIRQNQLGYKLDKNQSRNAIFDFRGTILDNIQDDLDRLLLVSLKENNLDFFKSIVYNYKNFLLASFEERNFFVFRKFVYFPVRIFYKIKDIKETENKKVLKENIRYLAELFNHHIEKEIKKTENYKDLKDIFGFIELIIESFQEIISLCVQNCDQDNLDNVIEKIQDIFSELDIKHFDLVYKQLGDTKNKSILDLYEQILDYKNVMLYGEASWTINLMLNKKIKKTSSKFVDSFFQALSLDKKDFAKVVNNALEDSFGRERYDFGWNFKRLEEMEPGKVYSSWGSPDSWLIQFYVLWLYKNLKLSDDSSVFVTGLEQIAQRKDFFISFIENLKHVNLSDFGLQETEKNAKLEKIKEIFELEVETSKKTTERLLIDAEIDEEKIKEFKNNFKKAWKKNQIARKLILKFGAYIDETNKKSGNNYLGSNTVAEKGAFVKDWPVGYLDWGSQYGQQIANTENKELINFLIKEGTAYSLSRSNDLIYVIDDLIDKIISDSLSPQIIFIPSKYTYQVQIAKNKDFVIKDNLIKNSEFDCFKNIHGFIGVYKNIPVFTIPFFNQLLNVIICDLEKALEWRQYHIFENKGEIYSILIGEITKEMATDWVQKNEKEWLVDKNTGVEKTKEQAMHELLQKVHLQYGENFKIILKDKKAIKIIKLVEKTDDKK